VACIFNYCFVRNSCVHQWNLHPETFHEITVAGRAVKEARWSTAWGRSYAYAGATNPVRPIHHPDGSGGMVADLLARANALTLGTRPEKRDGTLGSSCGSSNGSSSGSSGGGLYNGCLQNWYLPVHSIGLHADDERAMRTGAPIFSLSWGGPRRFLLRAKPGYLPASAALGPAPTTEFAAARAAVVELQLRDGDLLVMGGTCQNTHKHEVPKLRKTMDPPTGRRINWTIRAFT
jgi:hypothetical protein